MDNRTIAHFDLDSFFVSVEQLQNSYFKGKPILIGGKGDRGVVASCSYEARAFGVRSGMPMKRAMQLCPHALQVRGDMERYSYYSNIITEIIADKVPSYEKTSIDEFYIDLTGMDRFFGSYQFTSELRQTITKETGLPISFGMSINKTVSKVATTEAKPNGQKKIDIGTEKPFLAPLSVNKIPMIGTKTGILLKHMGIEKVKHIQAMPPEAFEQLLGKNGVDLWKKANGICNAPITPYSERKSISAEQTFQQDTIDIDQLKGVLIGMTEKLASQLRKEQQLTSCIAVKIRYSNFDTHTQQVKIPYTSCDHTLIQYVKDLFKKLYNRRMLIRLIGVRMSHLVHGNYQINLFEDSVEMIQLYQAMDKMNQRYGDKVVHRAISLGVRNRKGFNPFNGKIDQ